ncbi:lysophospholipid acyltransferase family protein [uncultured Sneathiella sp.]|jgi:KDO2-lipid IV(A) lauroyltransferase|uniref:lysophospholipid acyltransferase family protein n=2 Tax=uncultured Sneathiella sp. TaxID=879315 RepID=UPI0030DC365F|tara:strand:- start:5006 stop:5875 length:870 start_codon:yes stop_codon:yes gene_type:complete
MKDVSLKYRLEWIGVRITIWIFGCLGRRRAAAFGGWLARKIGSHMKVHSLARTNMEQALPDLSPEEIDINLMQMWDNLGRNIGELPFNKSIMADPKAVEIIGGEHMEAYLESEKAAFFVTAHYGPWELVGLVGQRLGERATGIYRAANNPLVEDFFQEMRADPHYKFVPKGREGARAILKAARAGGAIVLLNDQKLNGGMAVPFFGREAMTAPAVAEIACKMDVPIYPMRTERLASGKRRLTIYPAIERADTGDKTEDVYALLKAINETYEEWITERPDHWFWVHNRWS